MATTQTYKMKKGDTLAAVAKQFQHKKWETIWEAPENKALVAKRKKPDQLQPGDQLTIPPNEKEIAAAKEQEKKAADEKKAAKEKAYTLTVKGKKVVLPEKDFDAFQKEMLGAVRKAVLAVEMRVVAARTLWDSFHELNNDQKIVSWCVGLFGPKLPPESLISAAEAAFKKLQGAVAGGDFKKIGDEMKNATAPVNAAYSQMMKYQEAVISRSEKELAALEFTRDTAFDIVTAIGTAELGGTPAGGAAAGGASNLVKAAAGEFGKYLAGTSQGGAAATKAIVLDGVLGAASGAAGALIKLRGEKLIAGVAEKAAEKAAGKWVARLGTKRVQAFLAKRLEGAMKGGLEASVKNALKMVKGDATPAQFFEEVAKDMGLGATLAGLDPFIESKFAHAAADKLIAKGLKLTGKAGKKELVEIIAGLIKDKAKDGVAKSVEVALEKARGGESAEELGESAADEFARANYDELQEEIMHRLEAVH